MLAHLNGGKEGRILCRQTLIVQPSHLTSGDVSIYDFHDHHLVSGPCSRVQLHQIILKPANQARAPCHTSLAMDVPTNILCSMDAQHIQAASEPIHIFPSRGHRLMDKNHWLELLPGPYATSVSSRSIATLSLLMTPLAP